MDTMEEETKKAKQETKAIARNPQMMQILDLKM